ncbi:hypothetical protein QT972_10985 [Microcoleus sp. herbarium7]|uniref:hypothetical protein n=1 Tax=Microcoleus sp. herbarium7 TaxID=3055435 RepID=UPI002FD0EF73
MSLDTSEPIVDLHEIAIMLLAEATASEVENAFSNDEPFGDLYDDFLRSGAEICETFMCTILDSGIDIEPELRRAKVLALRIIKSIDAHLKGGFTFEEMYKVSKKGAHRQILSGLGHGVSFWDDCRHEDFGQDKNSHTVGYFESCYDEAYTVLTKLAAHREQNP